MRPLRPCRCVPGRIKRVLIDPDLRVLGSPPEPSIRRHFRSDGRPSLGPRRCVAVPAAPVLTKDLDQTLDLHDEDLPVQQPDAVKPVIRLLPLTLLNDALRAVINDAASLSQIAVKLALLAAWGLVTFTIGLKVFRWQ